MVNRQDINTSEQSNPLSRFYTVSRQSVICCHKHTPMSISYRCTWTH